MGDEGAATMSLDNSKFRIYRESKADKEVWNELVDQNRLKTLGEDLNRGEKIYVDETSPQIRYHIGKNELYNPFTAHMNNFTQAIFGKEDLNCPANEAYRTELPIFKIAQALRDNKNIITIDQDEYTV